MSLTQREAELKLNKRKYGFRCRNKYAKMSDKRAMDQVLVDTRKALKWMNENPGKALPLGY